MSIPEGATHKAIGPRIDCWYKNINCLGFEFMNQGGSEWLKRDGMPNWPYERIANEHPKPWSGPEDGLPPLNTVCQMMDGVGCWIDVIIIANYDGYAHGWNSSEKDCFYSNERNEFRPVQTGAEKRETAIRELMDIAQVDCRVTAARLVDAGFKR